MLRSAGSPCCAPVLVRLQDSELTDELGAGFVGTVFAPTDAVGGTSNRWHWQQAPQARCQASCPTPKGRRSSSSSRLHISSFAHPAPAACVLCRLLMRLLPNMAPSLPSRLTTCAH